MFEFEVLDLNERQKKDLQYIKKYGKIDNNKYQTLSGTTKPMATRDLQELTKREILIQIVKRGEAHIIR